MVKDELSSFNTLLVFKLLLFSLMLKLLSYVMDAPLFCANLPVERLDFLVRNISWKKYTQTILLHGPEIYYWDAKLITRSRIYQDNHLQHIPSPTYTNANKF